MYFGEYANFEKITIYSIITSNGDFLYMLTEDNINGYSF